MRPGDCGAPRCFSLLVLEVLGLSLLVAAISLLLCEPNPLSGLPDSVYIVDLTGVSASRRFAASVAVGQWNKQAGRPLAYALLLPNDWQWLQDNVDSNTTQVLVSDLELAHLVVAAGAVSGKVEYSTSESWSIPNVATLCGLRNAIPVPTPLVPDLEGSPKHRDGLGPFAVYRNLPLAANTRDEWSDSLAATSWALDNIFGQCAETQTTMVLQDPLKLMQGLLTDLVVARRLFAFWLPEMCKRSSESHTVYNSIVANARNAGSLLSIMGYYPEQEVVATCAEDHAEISLVSDFCSSLSFWSLFRPVNTPLVQNAEPLAMPYNPGHTYVAIIASDGDNMQVEFNANRGAMAERVRLCTGPNRTAACPPMSWTLSNRLATFAPPILQWYYRMAARTGRDSFLLGPSGFGFLHPGAIPATDPRLPAFVNQTIAAAELLGTDAYVHWDEYGNGMAGDGSGGVAGMPKAPAARHAGGMGTDQVAAQVATAQLQRAAMRRYLRRFDGTAIRGVFSPITPWVPAWVGDIATFREAARWFPGETPAVIAPRLLTKAPMGSLTYLYTIVGVPMDVIAQLAQELPKHVQLVDYRTLIRLAWEKRNLEEETWRKGDNGAEGESVRGLAALAA